MTETEKETSHQPTNQCSMCGAQNIEGALMCEHCGFNMAQTKEEDATHHLEQDSGELKFWSRWGSANIVDRNRLLFHIKGAQKPIIKELKDELILGRSGSDADTLDSDLAAYDGLDQGVSRQHAAIRSGGDMLFVVDLGSANGTYLNEVRLMPHQPHVLGHGDKLRLGKLIIQVYIQ